MTGVWLK